MGRHKQREGGYTPAQIMEKLFSRNNLPAPITTARDGTSRNTCITYVSRHLKDMELGDGTSDWVTDKTLNRVLRDKELNVYVIQKGQGVDREEAERIWRAGIRELELEYENYLTFHAYSASGSVEREGFYDIGWCASPMSKHDVDESVFKYKLNALFKALVDGFDEEAFRKDVKKVLMLDILETAATGHVQGWEDLAAFNKNPYISENDRDRIDDMKALEKKLGNLDNYGKLKKQGTKGTHHG